jgi:uncharacterized repeat protein (TIGR01451 family)
MTMNTNSISHRSISLILAGCTGTLLALLLVFLLKEHPPAYGATAPLDGVVDSAYGPPLAADPSGDLASSPGPADWDGTWWTDVISLHVTNDTRNLYVHISLPAYSSTFGTGSTGSFGLVVATGQYTATGSSPPTDPWGGAITFAYTATHANLGTTPVILPHRITPDFIIRGNIVGRDCCGFSDNGWTELRRWNGSDYGTGAGTNWGGSSGGALIGDHVAFADYGGIEFSIPFTDLGISYTIGAPIHLQFYATQTGGTKGAYDTVPADDQSTGWDDPTTQRLLVTYVLTISQDVILAAPAEGAHFVQPGITATGYVTPTENVTLTLSLNATQAFTPALDAQGRFTQPLTLSPGANTITATAVGALGVGFDVRHVTYGPLLTVTAPVEWQHFVTTSTNVTGQAAPAENVTVTVEIGGVTHTPTVDPGSGAFDQTVGLSNGVNAITVTAQNSSGSDTHVVHVTQGAAGHDDDVWWGCLGHFTRDEAYRDPWGAQPAGTTVTLRLRACAGDLTGATLRAWPANLPALTAPMTGSTVLTDPLGAYEYWEVQVALPSTPTVLFYKFEAVDGTDADWYIDDTDYDGRNGRGCGSDDDGGFGFAFDLTVYDPAFTTPSWIQNGIVYQIFPDRFRDGDPANNVVSGTHFFYGDPIGGLTYTTWNAQVVDPRNPSGPLHQRFSEDFYGGDLQGVIDRLDYLQELGVTAVYLNPTFWSPSNHKYDTTNFGVIDPHLGDRGDFTQLIAAATQRDIVVVLDGVFNHSSSDSIYFDRYGQHTTDGACESETSPYRDWYYFHDVTPGAGPCVGSDGTPNGADYDSWWGYDTLPKLRSGNSEVQDYFWGADSTSIGGRWVISGSHGWRLDVGADVDSGAWYEPANGYWEGFRQTVKAANPDAIIFGEEWSDARSWLLGNEWDSVMNYRFRSALLSFMRDLTYWDNDNNAASSGGTLDPITVSGFDRWLRQIQEDYPPQAWYAMVNLVGSHDTNRVRFVLSKWQKGYDDTDPIPYDPATDLDPFETDRRQMLMALIQFTMPGAPTVYYGDEMGLDAPGAWYDKWEDDPYNRVPFPWNDTPGYYQARPGVHARYARLAHLRRDHPALRTGTFDTLLTDDANEIYVYGRKRGGDWAVVVVNRDETAHATAIDLTGYLPAGTVLRDVLHGGGPYTITASGAITVAVTGLDGRILAPFPDLGLRKEVTPTASLHLGDAATYTVVLSNDGAGPATGVLLTDTLPAEVDFAHWVEQPSGASAIGGEITWNGTVTAGQAVTFTFVVTHTGGYGDVITNTARYTHVTDSGSAVVTFSVAGPPALNIAKSVTLARDPAQPGDPITYTIVVSNTGPADATGVVVTDTLPGGVSGSDLYWTGVVAANDRVTFTIEVTVAVDTAFYGRSITNTAYFSQASRSGFATAVFSVIEKHPVYLPLVARDYSATEHDVPWHILDGLLLRPVNLEARR